MASSSPKFRPISRLFVRLWRGKIVPSSKNRSLNWRGFHRFADKDYAPMVDKKIAKVMLKEYRRLVAPKSQPAYFSVIDSKF